MKSIIFVSLGLLLISSVALASSVFDDPILKTWLAELNFNPDRFSDPNAAPTAQIRNGTVRGQTVYSGFTKIYRYLGIPFAKAPVGNLRFQPPQPYEGWGDGEFQATSQPNSCTQFLTNFTRSDEDCLYLSVYTRRNGDSDRLLPVIYFIHGGGYALGQNSYYRGGKILKNEEVVLVTVQYRLGPIGFLATGDDTVSANNGMKDMVQGLRWVQENIAAFGGDPNQVTVMGESAGSASALYMLISPLAQGLFHRVVAMSGTPLQEWAIDRHPEVTSKKLAKLMNCPTENNRELVDCLMGKDWMPIIRAGFGVIMEDFLKFKILLSGMTPVIEGDVPGAFLPDDPLKLLKEGPLPNVPVLMGAVQQEGVLPLAAGHFLILQPNGLLNDSDYMRDYFIGDMLSTYGVNERIDGASISQALALGFMPEGADITKFSDYRYELLDAVSVVFMKAPILRTASILSRRNLDVYLYSFEYYSKNSLYNWAYLAIELVFGYRRPLPKSGVCHGDDLMYMFRLPFILSQKDQAFSKSYVELFTNFAIHGNPTPQATAEYPIWPKYDDTEKNYLRMASTFEVKQDYTRSWRQGEPPI